jgi:hypothetical protein
MITTEIKKAYDLDAVRDVYQGKIEITDLQKDLGTSGHILVVRGDRAYGNKVGDKANPKFWLYENILKSQRIKTALENHPEFRLFDGTGYSSLEALKYHANRLSRKATIVMSREMYEHLDRSQFKDLEIISADGPAEEGYVKKQAEVLQQKNDIIPLHQALYGARALAPVGNNIVSQLEKMDIIPDETFWVCASGSNLYGLGSKIKRRFPNCETNLVEPADQRTVEDGLDLKDPRAVKSYALEKLKKYNLDNWKGEFDSEEFPLHISHPNRYLLLNWANTGRTGIDRTIGVSRKERKVTASLLEKINPDYRWTGTTNFSLAPAIQSAKAGKNVVVMAYGKRRE